MKIWIGVLGGLIMLLGQVNAQVTVIERPVVGNSNAEGVDIRKIGLCDTATVVWMDIYSRPGEWIDILSGTTLQSKDGKKSYRLSACEGVGMDRRTIVPEQGYVSCKLTFEPVDPAMKVVNYVEPGNGNWFIGDIHLYPEEKKESAITCRIRGEVKDRPYSGRLILTKAGGDVRTVGISVPIREGKFEYLLQAGYCEAYSLSFQDELYNGSWYPVTFFAEPGVVEMVLYPMDDHEKNVIRGGEENRRFTEFLHLQENVVPLKEVYARRDRLEEEGKYYSGEALRLEKQIAATDDRRVQDSLWTLFHRLEMKDSIYSPEGREIEDELLRSVQQKRAWTMKYIREHPSLSCYYHLLREFRSYMQAQKYEDIPRFLAHRQMDKTEVKAIVEEVYRPLFPDHPYTVEMDRLMQVMERIRVGGDFIDFVAPDLETGEAVRLSDRIRGKVALLDLWASWCGPCRSNAKAMIPVYGKYKDKGFTVVGVAREKSRQNGWNAARQDGHPWVDLLELNDRGKIWEMYGVGNAGGGTFLIGRDGKILLVDPKPEEIVRIMEEQK